MVAASELSAQRNMIRHIADNGKYIDAIVTCLVFPSAAAPGQHRCQSAKCPLHGQWQCIMPQLPQDLNVVHCTMHIIMHCSTCHYTIVNKFALHCMPCVSACALHRYRYISMVLLPFDTFSVQSHVFVLLLCVGKAIALSLVTCYCTHSFAIAKCNILLYSNEAPPIPSRVERTVS